MSWSISANGPKDEALAAIRSQASGQPYNPGTPEGDDIVAAVARIEALAGAIYSEKVFLSAHGSHSTTPNGIARASFSVSVAS
jgi:hypothetical protein